MLGLKISNVNAQARSGLGIAATINTSNLGIGYGGELFGEIKVAKAVSLVPAIGYAIPKGISFSVNGRYFFDKSIFVNAGPMLHLSSLEYGDSGIGGSVGLGFSQRVSKIAVVDWNLNIDLVHYSNKMIPVYGVKLIFEGVF